MADSTEKSDKATDSKVALNLGVALSGEAKGSQTLLLALGISATLLLFSGLIAGGVGLYASMVGLSIMGIVPIGIGCVGWWKCLLLWSKSQPIIDAPQHPPLIGNISFKAGSGTAEIAISGTDSLVLQDTNRDLLITMINRYFSQQPLPAPTGQVIGSPADKQSLHEYSNSEAEQAKTQIAEAVVASKQQLADILRLAQQDQSKPDDVPLTLADPSRDVTVVNEDEHSVTLSSSPERIVATTKAPLATRRAQAIKL